MSLYFALLTVENNKNKKFIKFQGDMLNFCDFIQVFVFTTNHHLKQQTYNEVLKLCVFSTVELSRQVQFRHRILIINDLPKMKIHECTYCKGARLNICFHKSQIIPCK